MQSPEFELFTAEKASECALILPVGELAEARAIHALLCSNAARPFVLAAFAVADWNDALTPWPAPALRRGAAFGGHAADTLHWLQTELLPRLPAFPYLIGGYSLAGLFSLWAYYESCLFQGAASCSGSLWYPGWQDYAQQRLPPTGGSIYLSLGEREPQARDQLLATIGACTQAQYQLAVRQGQNATLQWHPGGHFQQPNERTAQGLLWLLSNARI